MTSITSVVGLFEIVRDLYGGSLKGFEESRPDEDSLTEHLELCSEFFDQLLAQIPEYKSAFVSAKTRPGDYRKSDKNHLLFRPIGQRAFTRAVELLVSRGDTVAAAVKNLRGAELFIHKEDWHYIVWNPIDGTMITNKILLAEAQLLSLAGQPLRNKAIAKKLAELLASVAEE